MSFSPSALQTGCLWSRSFPAFSVPGSFEYDQWLEKTRTALRDEYLLQLDAAAKSALADGRETDAERFWQRYLQEEPLCETVSVSLMELYRARRDYNRAALVYRSLHKAMSDWLGITPLKETSALYYSIMEEWNARADPEDQRSDDFLVGRQEQLQSLFQLFPGPGSGQRRQSFVLLGEAGVGKSHLLAHFLAHGAVSDAQIVTTSCFKSKQEEYLYPWQAVMLSIASYIRKEDIPIPTAYRQAVSALFPVFGSGEGSVEKKAHMLIDSVMSFDSVLMILSLAAEKRPLLLVLEDIQWMDKISADLLDQLLHKADSSRILFAATCRQPSGPVATPLLRGLEEDGLCRCCHLSPFTKDETMEFIQLYGAQSLPQADKERIYQDTQGNAFLLTQLIGSIMENGRPTVLPRNMEEILSYRLSGLTDEGLQVLNLVAMFPDRAPYPVLERVSSKPTLDLLYVCQELCRRSILTEVYDGGALSLAFAQAEFRELTYSRIPALSRRILHLNIAQALADLSPASVPDLDALTAYHYDQGGDQFHAMQYKVHRFKTYVVFNYALLNGMPREGEVLLNSTPQALDQFHRMERELQELQRLHPGDQALKKVEWDLYYSVGCFCIYRGLYQEGLDAIRRILDDPAAPVELLDLAHEQMTFYGIQTYQTQVMREHIQIALALTQGRDPARYAVNRRYNGYLLVMENRYEEGREELLRSLMLLRDGVTDDVELRLQSAYAHDYIGEACRKQGSYEKAIGEYQMAIQTIGTFPTSTSKPTFYVNWAQAALAQADYAAARQALAQADRATGYLKEPSGYFQTLFCVYSALFAFADGDAQDCVSYLTQCQQLTDLLIVPCDTGILYLVKGLLRRLCDRMDQPPAPLDRYLDQSCESYCAQSRSALKGKAGVFELELLHRLDLGSADPLPGLLQVTEN